MFFQDSLPCLPSSSSQGGPPRNSQGFPVGNAVDEADRRTRIEEERRKKKALLDNQAREFNETREMEEAKMVWCRLLCERLERDLTWFRFEIFWYVGDIIENALEETTNSRREVSVISTIAVVFLYKSFYSKPHHELISTLFQLDKYGITLFSASMITLFVLLDQRRALTFQKKLTFEEGWVVESNLSDSAIVGVLKTLAITITFKFATGKSWSHTILHDLGVGLLALGVVYDFHFIGSAETYRNYTILSIFVSGCAHLAARKFCPYPNLALVLESVCFGLCLPCPPKIGTRLKLKDCLQEAQELREWQKNTFREHLRQIYERNSIFFSNGFHHSFTPFLKGACCFVVPLSLTISDSLVKVARCVVGYFWSLFKQRN